MRTWIRYVAAATTVLLAPRAQVIGSFTSSGLGCPAPLGIDIQADDDEVLGPFALGFNFPYPRGRSTNSIDIASNGYVYLESGTNGNTRCCNGSSALPDFLAATPSFAVWGQDLQPDFDGAIRFWTDNSTVAAVTWLDVPEFSNQPRNTFQIQLRSDGTVTMWFERLSLAGHDALVGFSPGRGATDPGSTDLNGAIPPIGSAGAALYELFRAGVFDLAGTSLEFQMGVDAYSVLSAGQPIPFAPVELKGSPIPTVGQSFEIEVVRVPAIATVGSLLIGVGPGGPGIDLSSLGMDACSLYSAADIAVVPLAFRNARGATSFDLTGATGLVGSSLALQAAALAPGVNDFGVVLSNLGSATIGDTVPIRITASGANSFNADETSGFFRVDNGSSLAILSVEFDWASSSNPAQTTMRFDTGQVGMADRFDAGNFGVPGCFGTYRNNSDLLTGLDYANSSTAACGSGFTGWTSTGAVGGANSDVRFRFTSFDPGDVFEVDIDTDGGLGFDGGSMAGMVVTVGLSDGSVRTGELVRIDAENSRLDL